LAGEHDEQPSRVKLCGVAVPGGDSLLGVDVGARGEVLPSAMMA
jgi:hypothetical protein